MNRKRVVRWAMIALLVACASQALATVSSLSAPPGYKPVLEQGSSGANAALGRAMLMYIPETTVLLIEDAYPWGYDSNALALAEAGVDFARITSSELATTDLSGVRVVMYSSDQPTSFYQNIAAQISRIADFVSAGGTLVAHSCDWGWSGGDWGGLEILPGGVDHVLSLAYDALHITDPAHPVVAGLDDAYFYGWGSSSHGYFLNLVPGTNVVIQTDTAEPTYMEYPWGAGRVLATMQTIEWGYGDGVNYWYIYRPEFLRNEIAYVSGAGAHQLDVGDGSAAPGGVGTVAVDLSDTAGVAGFQFDLLYDPVLIAPADVRKGPVIAPDPDWVIHWNVVEPGRLAILAYSATATGLPEGAGPIAEVDFAADPGAIPYTSCVLHPAAIYLSNSAGDPIPVSGADGVFTIRPPVDHFTFVPPVPTPQGGDLTNPVENSDPLPFLVRVEARDVSDVLVPSYSGTATLTSSVGTPQPSEITFTNGVWEGNVTILADLDPECYLTVTDQSDPSITDNSNMFNLRGKGDPTDDGAVNVLDVLRVVNIVLGRAVPEPPRFEFQFWAADMNRDHDINIQDVILVVRKSLGLSAAGAAAAQAVATGPVVVSLVEEGKGIWAVRVRNAAGLAGMQLEIAGGQADVSAGDLIASAGWQVHANRVQGRLRIIAYSPTATGLTVVEGTLLRLTNVRGKPRLASVVLSDSSGREMNAR